MNTKTTKASTAAAGFMPLLCCALLIGSALIADRAGATPGTGVVGEPIALGALPAPIRAKLKSSALEGFGDGTAVTNIVVAKFTIEPGGVFGWHRHGGPVWAVVAAGTLTEYEGDDFTCTGHAYGPGAAFLDPGDHVHNARNEGLDRVVVYATFMLPAGGELRVDATDPGVCPF